MQTTSRRLADRKVEKFEKNITKRGAVPETTVKKGNDYPVGPVLLGFFIFVVIGSCKIIAWFHFLHFSLLVILIYISSVSSKFHSCHSKFDMLIVHYYLGRFLIIL